MPCDPFGLVYGTKKVKKKVISQISIFFQFSNVEKTYLNDIVKLHAVWNMMDDLKECLHTFYHGPINTPIDDAHTKLVVLRFP